MVAHELDGDEAALAFLGVLAGFDGYQAVLAVIFVEQVLEVEVVAFCHGVVCCDGAAGVVLIVAVQEMVDAVLLQVVACGGVDLFVLDGPIAGGVVVGGSDDAYGGARIVSVVVVVDHGLGRPFGGDVGHGVLDVFLLLIIRTGLGGGLLLLLPRLREIAPEDVQELEEVGVAVVVVEVRLEQASLFELFEEAPEAVLGLVRRRTLAGILLLWRVREVGIEDLLVDMSALALRGAIELVLGGRDALFVLAGRGEGLFGRVVVGIADLVGLSLLLGGDGRYGFVGDALLGVRAGVLAEQCLQVRVGAPELAQPDGVAFLLRFGEGLAALLGEPLDALLEVLGVKQAHSANFACALVPLVTLFVLVGATKLPLKASFPANSFCFS